MDQEEAQWPDRDHVLGEDPGNIKNRSNIRSLYRFVKIQGCGFITKCVVYLIGPEIVIIDPAIDQDRDPEEDQNQEIVEVEEIDTDLVQDQEIAKRARVIDPDQKNRRRNVRGPEVERKKEAGEAEAKKKKGQKIKGNLGINLLEFVFRLKLYYLIVVPKLRRVFITFSSDNGVDSKGGISDNNGDSSLHKKDVDHEAVINDEIRNQSFLPGNNNGESEYEDKGGGKRRSRTKSPSRKRSKSKDRGERRKRSRYKCFGSSPMK